MADYFAYLIEEGGGDGFQITPSYYAPDFYADIVDRLVPVLQRRGMMRTRHGESRTLRDSMTEF